MNTAQITHIFWKEYRTQRSIWLGILLIAVVIQGLVWSMMPMNARDPLATLASIGAILSVFYALASAGVLFAGEREEQTYSWLRILPISNLSLFGGKFLWLAVSWLLAVGVSLLTAYLPYWGTELNSHNIMDGLTQFAVMGGGLALWGIFFSLLCQRVYTSLALAPLALLLTAGLNSYFPGIAYVLYAAVFIGSVVQGRRWIVEENLAMWTGIGWRSRALMLDDVLATAVEASPAWRFFRRELWLEWRNARWVALGSFTLMAAVICFLKISDLPDASTISWFLMFALLPLAFGVNTFRAEQNQSRYRFQSQVGASPAAVWTAKHLVWGGLLLPMMIPALLLMIAQSDTLFTVLPVPQNSWLFLWQERFYESWQPTVVLSFSVALWMYSVGHVCSLLIKRSVSAALVAVAWGVFVCVSVATTFFLDVPRVIGMGLPAGLLLAFGLWRTKGWLSERNESRDWVRVFSVLTTLGLVCMASWVMWRMKELTSLSITAGFVALFPVTGLLQISVFGGGLLLLILCVVLIAYRHKLTVKRIFVGWSVIHVLSVMMFVAAFSAKIEPPSEAMIATLVPSQELLETGDRYRELDLLISDHRPFTTTPEEDATAVWSDLFTGNRDLSEALLAWLDENETTLQRLVENTNRNGCAPDNLFESRISPDQQQLSIASGRSEALLRLSALRQEQSENLDQAWVYHLALQRFYRHYSQNQTPHARNSILYQLREYVRVDLKRWVNRSDQTPDRLSRSAIEFTSIGSDLYSLESSFALQGTHQQWAVANENLGNWSSQTSELFDWPVFLEQSLHHLPGEKQRALFVLQAVENHQMRVANGIRKGDSSKYGPELSSYPLYWYAGARPVWESWNQHSWARDVDHLWRLAETTPIVQAANQHLVEGYGNGPDRSHQILVNELTWIQYRRLVLLQMAFRVAEMQTDERVNSLEKLVELKSDPAIASILGVGEGMEGSYSRLSGYNQDDDEWKSMFYYDPISDRRFEMSTINMFRLPRTE